MSDVSGRTAYAVRDCAPRVTVIGDPLLDGWWVGRSERRSREAPALVVEVEQRRYAPGGAANTAVNLAALGGRVRLIGVVGDDEPGRMLVELLTGAGVDVSGLIRSADVATVTKNRVLSGGQILLRIDELGGSVPSTMTQAELATAIDVAIPGSDAVIVCDYGSELADGVRATLAAGPRPPLLVVDAHDPARWADLQPDLVTPNAAEAFRLLGRAVPEDASRVASIETAQDEVLRRTGAAAAVITLDRDGTVVVQPGEAPHRTRARPGPEQQTAGAGDTFVAALTLARAAGLPLVTAAELAQAAADVVVHRFGTSVCSTEDLADQLSRSPDLVLDEDTLARRIEQERAAGKRIVLTNGCFDVLHRGHTTSLDQAARLGDILVVAINSDESVRRLKGPERPVNTAADRAGVIAALSCVDYVTVFATDTPIPLLERLRPDVYAKGGDYSPEMLAEAGVVRAYGGEVRMLDYIPSQSTTSVVARIRASAPPPRTGQEPTRA